MMTEKKVEKRQENSETHDVDHSKLDLRGTFMMVMFLGGLIFVSWFGAFILFLDRM